MGMGYLLATFSHFTYYILKNIIKYIKKLMYLITYSLLYEKKN